MRVLHLSADYPDPIAPQKTHAIRNLLAMASGIEHRVYSLNRVTWPLGIAATSFDDACGGAHRAIVYGAPPKGLLMANFLDRLADWVLDDVGRGGFAPDIVHAHKLSVEGLIGERLVGRLGAALALSSQGDSDTRIVSAKRDLRPRYARIWKGAAVAFPFAPWTRWRLNALLGERLETTLPMPCPAGDDDSPIRPRLVEPVVRSAFHLASWRRKNADGLIEAIGRVARMAPETRLEILGGGDPKAFAALARHADRVAPGAVTLRGAVDLRSVRRLFNESCAVALPSRRETFGMALSEALLAGAPCLVPRGWAIDGYLADGDGVVYVDPADGDAIVDGLRRLTVEQEHYKRRLGHLQEQGCLDIFRRAQILNTYRTGLRIALEAPRAFC